MRTIALLVSLVAGFSGGHGDATVSVRPSSFGSILFDGRGFVLYAFTKDPQGRSTCSGPCAAAWPPFIVRRSPRAGTGIKGSMIGVVKRSDGRLQAAYAGKPLYYYIGDRKPGQILCQNVTEFGGIWRVIRGDGTLVH
jgi:predicted lipoprotein with Yx(FWY)xxD motif